MLGENHSVHQEFPNKKDLINKLMVENINFKILVKKYDAIDKEIRVIELKCSPIDDLSFIKMKKTRSHLKDEIYQILQ